MPHAYSPSPRRDPNVCRLALPIASFPTPALPRFAPPFRSSPPPPFKDSRYVAELLPVKREDVDAGILHVDAELLVAPV